MGCDFNSQGSGTFDREGVAHDDFDSWELSEVAVELDSDPYFD